MFTCQNFRFHKTCAERAAETAGYFFKCPLCCNKDDFEHEMKRFGVSFVCTWFPFKATFRLVKIKCEYASGQCVAVIS